MSQLSRTPLLRATLGAPLRVAPKSLPRAATLQTRWASSSDNTPDPKTPQGSFKGQMMESVAGRIARERKELAAVARERQSAGTGTNYAITMSELTRLVF